MILTIVIGIIVLSVLIIVHELGHYIPAKAFKVWVEEFGLGMPPRLWGKKWGDTIYSLNWIPFGGFNKLSGEVDPDAPRALAAKSHFVRLLVLGGGIIMNLILPFILLAAAYMVPHDVIVGEIVVQAVYPDSPAQKAGILPGDTILGVNGQPLHNGGELSRFTQLNLGKEIAISVRRADGAETTLNLVPRRQPPPDQGPIGTLSRTTNVEVVTERLPFFPAVATGARSCIEALVLYKNGIVGMIIGTVPFVPAGPVGIVQVTGEVAHSGISPVFELAAFISIAIAITQLIPFPALDGGRMLFVLIEWARRGKRVPPKVEGIVHSIGFIILLALLTLITYQDILRWVSGGSLIP